jgi:phage baseplate assembly protein W
MSEATVFGKGISFPPRIGPDGRIAWSSGPDNIREAIRVILLTEFHERIMLPEFGGGLRTFLFQPNTVATRQLIQERTQRALIRWEPRIEVQHISVEAIADDPEAALMVIEYRLVATGATDQLNMTLQFAA